jgi:DNA-binding MarR family transcriptional regulator
MTNRLDHLEKRGLIERIVDPHDRWGLKIMLTDEGFKLADDLVASHVQTEDTLLAGLNNQDCTDLRRLLAKIRA